MESLGIPEIERKFEVDANVQLPDFGAFSGVKSCTPVEREGLVALYFDTADLTLARNRIVVRRRSGGHDAGWHVKVQAREDERTEFHSPLSGGIARVPESLLAAAGVDVATTELIPIVVLRTDRLRRLFLGPAGETVGEFCADTVHAERLVGPPLSSSWREWELEAVPASRQFLGTWSAALVAKGATSATYPSKLVRALGARKSLDELPSLGPASGEGGLVSDFFSRQRAKIIVSAVGAELNDPDAIHDVRVACRTVRAVARALHHFSDSAQFTKSEEDCRWLAEQVGTWRDVHIIYAGIHAFIESQSPGEVSDEFSQLLKDEELARSGGAELEAKQALASHRFGELTNRLTELVTGNRVPPGRSPQSEKKLCRKLLVRDVERMERQMAKLRHESSTGTLSYEELHGLRRQVKRQRYLAEFCSAGLPGRAAKVALAARALQEELGGIQDLVVIRKELKRISLTIEDRPDLVAEISAARSALKAQVETARDEFVGLLRITN